MFEEMIRNFEKMPTVDILYLARKVGKILLDRETLNPTYFAECEKEALTLE